MQTLQRHQPSGEIYCLEYDTDGQISQVAGPITMQEARECFVDLGELPGLESTDVEWARSQQWGYPLTATDLAN